MESTSRIKPKPGRVVVLTGDGKGKSSSALGMVLRAVGWGLRVAVIQFIKGSAWPTGEEQAARRLGVEWQALGDGFTWDTANPEQDRATSRAIWQRCQEVIDSDRYDLVVLDEINYVMSYGWLDPVEVATALSRRPPRLHLILTGRDAPEAVVALADTVTTMLETKHPFHAGITAVKGIEF